MNAEGIPIRSNLSDEDTENYSALVSQLAIKAHHVVRTLDEGDELAFLRVRDCFFVTADCRLLHVQSLSSHSSDVYILILPLLLPTCLMNRFDQRNTRS